METVINFIKKYAIIIIAVTILLLFVSNCSANKETRNLSKRIDSLTVVLEDVNGQLNGFANQQEIKSISEKVMYQFLIYEDDIDKGKLSLSEVELRLTQIKTEEQK